MKINLRIERLILDGVTIEPRHQHLLLSALENELSGLLIAGGIPSNLHSGGVFNTVCAEAISVGERNEPLRLGRDIARSIHGGLSR